MEIKMSKPKPENPGELSAEEIAEQASKPDVDQIHRQIRRGKESHRDADDPGR